MDKGIKETVLLFHL